MVPSMSIVAQSKNSSGCLAQTFRRVVVDDVDEGVDVRGREAAAEVAGRGGIGNAASAEGVEEVLVVAAQFDVLQTGAAAQGVVGDVEHVVGFVIGQVELEQMQALVDGLDQADALEPAGEWRRCRRR